MAEKEKENNVFDINKITETSKEMVTTTTELMTTMNNVAWAPWIGLAEKSNSVAALSLPWLDVNRYLPTLFLNRYALHANKMIEYSCGVTKNINQP